MISEALSREDLRLDGDELVLVDFYSDDCVFCERLAPVLEDVSFELPFVTIIKINCSSVAGISEEFDVFAFPTLKLYRAGEELDSATGFRPADALKTFIAAQLY